MFQLKDKELLELYKRAIQLKIEEDFIALLKMEITRRGLEGDDQNSESEKAVP